MTTVIHKGQTLLSTYAFVFTQIYFSTATTMWPFSSNTAEREYVSLMFKATSCYASWDPLRPVRVRAPKCGYSCRGIDYFHQVGDYGRLQDDGSFAPLENIFENGMAEKYKIRQRTEGQDECRYIVSDNGSSVSVAPDVDMCALTSPFPCAFHMILKVASPLP